jgi:SpoIIAA-like
MIERLAESHKAAFGFKVIGELTADDVASLSQKIDGVVAQHRKPIGILADLSVMRGATWAARWEEMRFLHRHSDHVARLAIVGDSDWQEISEMVPLATAILQAQTLYFHSSEIIHAWHWVKMARTDESMPTRVMYSGKGLFHDYTPEYMQI